jgi:protein-S-isoprenylcysteine O-methyltransferase Ste14
VAGNTIEESTMDLGKAARDPWVWGQVALMAAVAALAPRLSAALPRSPEIRWVGAALLAFGFLRAGLALHELGSSLTPGTEPLPDADLVTTGAYEQVRHPIYTAVILMLTGYAMLWRSWLLGMVVFVVATAYFEGKARREERWLRERFPEYETYMRRSARLFPGLW